DPNRTVLLFGAGSSIPSGAPSTQELIEILATRAEISAKGFKLAEIASLAERKLGRRRVIEALRSRIKNLKPTGGILNLPLYDWKSIFTTNYDDLIEQCYLRRDLALTRFTSDFDFTIPTHPTAPKLFKLHGSIETDEVDGHRSRLILTLSDS